MGFVAAAGYVPITAVLSKWFSVKERGFAMEMYSGPGGGLGEALTFLLIPLIALFMTDGGIFGLTGWRGSTFFMGIVVLAIAISSAFMLRSDPSDMGLPSIQKAEDKKKDENYAATVKGIIKDPALWVMSIVWSGYMVAGGAMATVYVLGRVFGTPLVGKLSDHLLKRNNTPRSVVICVGLVLIAAMFYTYTTPIPTTFAMGALAFFSGIVINIFPLINASCAEIWSIRATGFSMGIINTVGQFAGALALSASGYMAVKYSIKGGAFYTEFLGIWYLGIITSIVAAIAAVYVIYREKRAFATHAASDTSGQKSV